VIHFESPAEAGSYGWTAIFIARWGELLRLDRNIHRSPGRAHTAGSQYSSLAGAGSYGWIAIFIARWGGLLRLDRNIHRPLGRAPTTLS